MRKGLYRIILMFEFFKTWFHTLDTAAISLTPAQVFGDRLPKLPYKFEFSSLSVF